MQKLAFIIFENFEELEAVAPIDILRRAKLDVSVLTLSDTLETKGRSNITIKADHLFAKKQNEIFDAIAIAGGAGVYDAVNSEALIGFIKKHRIENKIIAAICAAPIILKKAGVLDGKKVAAHTSVLEQFEGQIENSNVVVDGNTITSQGAGTAIDFALALAEKLCGTNTAEEIARSICFNK